ncbi:unnamed protein product, partial [Mesorhabditis belari]|uniref:Flavin-containing monooxygenase n=1 Tax=Mesorhabditis belari TaxID=2138241 RepID=A0AAF3ERA1_9BILA
MEAQENAKKRVCVVGAGGSGLPCIRWAKEYDFDVTCFEGSNGIGGLWHYKPGPTDLSNVMRSTVINTSKEMLAYSDFPPDEKLPIFMHHSALHRYLKDYCTHHDLWKHIKLQHKRTSDYAETGRWTVEYLDSSGQSHENVFDAVLVATGHQATPNYPQSFPGQESFTGKISHSHDYRSPTGYDEKTVVVVGVGNSGADIASELARVTKQVYLVARRGGVWIFNRMADRGIPLDYILGNRFTTHVMMKFSSPKRLSKKLEKSLNKKFDHEKAGIKPPFGPLCAHPTVCDELPLRLTAGTVVMRPQIKMFTQTSVIFEDDTEAQNVDEVIFCTGFTYDLKILENGKTLPVENNHHPGLYLHMFPPELDKNTLCFVGLLMPWGGLFPAAEMQARLFCAQLAGEVELPPVDQMNRVIAQEIEAAKKRFVNSQRHNFEVDYDPYMDRLAGMLGCMPKNFKLFLTDFSFFRKVFFGPSIPAIYRIHGKHAWPGAREAYLGLEHRTTCVRLPMPGANERKWGRRKTAFEW